MKKSKIIKGDIQHIETQLDTLLNQGFEVVSFQHDESGYFYCLLVKK